ncbi:hypothetical protein Nham_3898 [Nitrobacter hamburgensis X14]|uniref:Uncharacterized protein n=1 Tax=Nitrobacter hamburgensis (strain DSM 10229 / NCIMB 13809 / X14) TaxID=323097 RepID=Q1QGQ7_NITHX|nr:hypothetical protein Nham_3898 [Nitrobacter hamburgensis X14]
MEGDSDPHLVFIAAPRAPFRISGPLRTRIKSRQSIFVSLPRVGGKRSTGPSQILSRYPKDLLSGIERGESFHRRVWPFSRDYNPSGVNFSDCRAQIGDSAPDCVIKRDLVFGCSLLRHHRTFLFFRRGTYAERPGPSYGLRFLAPT